MKPTQTSQQAKTLQQIVKGDVCDSWITRLIFSTDASAYQEIPVAVVWPNDDKDIEQIIQYANKNQVPLIPRGAGTSLAGQVVGNGIIVDISKKFNKIIEINAQDHWVDVEPGIVLDELNKLLKPHKLFFGPETSTSNRCTIGGMLGNNSCGSRSLVYGSVRDHLIEVEGYLPNGQKVTFSNLTTNEFQQKLSLSNFEGELYRNLYNLFANTSTLNNITQEYPHSDIKRRNTGYAIDLLTDSDPFRNNNIPFNFCKIIAGSEGTLFFATRIRLNLLPLTNDVTGLLCVHLHTLKQALQANLIALQYKPLAIELMDDNILELTKNNSTQDKNRAIVQGNPKALLMIELSAINETSLLSIVNDITMHLQSEKLGYAYPLLTEKEIGKAWALRKAGLGVLSNMPGDALPAPVIEDTAVSVYGLEAYLTEIEEMLSIHNKSCVYYGHIGTGELHLRPILNMKDDNDRYLFRLFAKQTALIVKKYNGSLSGEHGDGRLRGEFIPLMIGQENYQLLIKLKQIFDPNNLFNPGKITNTPPMDEHLRYSQTKNPIWTPSFRWDKTGGLLQGADKCNGSADCRKSLVIGGSMCPTYMLTGNENQTTRARANLLRFYLSNQIGNDSNSIESVKSILDNCIMCKACKTECPSNIDMAKLKTEFLYHYGQKKGFALRDYLFAYQHLIFNWAKKTPLLFNKLSSSKLANYLARKTLRIDMKDKLPKLSSAKKYQSSSDGTHKRKKEVYLFIDEIIAHDESSLGSATLLLLRSLGYKTTIAPIDVSGRTFLSKGMLDKARKIANQNTLALSKIISTNSPIIGIEPSAILTLRDEYLDLVDESLVPIAKSISENSFTIEEFLSQEMDLGEITKEQFTHQPLNIHYHAHCYQKALSSSSVTQKILSFPTNYEAIEIKSGCCGMAGSFGYESEHADLSRQIGEMTLFPAIRANHSTSTMVAAGASCRSHIKTNTKVESVHPVMVLLDALICRADKKD